MSPLPPGKESWVGKGKEKGVYASNSNLTTTTAATPPKSTKSNASGSRRTTPSPTPDPTPRAGRATSSYLSPPSPAHAHAHTPVPTSTPGRALSPPSLPLPAERGADLAWASWDNGVNGQWSMVNGSMVDGQRECYTAVKVVSRKTRAVGISNSRLEEAFKLEIFGLALLVEGRWAWKRDSGILLPGDGDVNVIMNHTGWQRAGIATTI
ncbi:hypothetical protein CPB84DRAFT_1745561 [Gymnopilus junonius]|uniref:Uncharacterized protein n=1 Tax=Gymnopilus junonius TaxID=109634 RepID=A0A9P5NSU0_GYMJU|nr:hypothetical protein CPB84DRAFT_1745561 [Gymnopilus junonius]